MYLLTKYCKKFFRKGRTFLKYSSTEVEKNQTNPMISCWEKLVTNQLTNELTD